MTNRLSTTTAAVAAKYLRSIWGLMGDNAKKVRVAICRELSGQNIPAAKCGVNNAMAHLWAAYGDGSTYSRSGMTERKIAEAIEREAKQKTEC